MGGILHVIIKGKKLFVIVESGSVHLTDSCTDSCSCPKADQDQAAFPSAERTDITGFLFIFRSNNPDGNRFMATVAALRFPIIALIILTFRAKPGRIS